MKRELRPHQSQAIEMLRQSLGSSKRRPVLQAPTGFGKTRLAVAVVEGALAKKKRVIFTVPALSLVDQTVEAFWNDGIREVGVIQGTHAMTDWSRPVQVASVQTLQRRPIPEADVVMIDECHRWFDFYPKWMMDPAWQSRPFIGLSATPWTRGLGRYFDDLIIAATTQDLIAGGISRHSVYSLHRTRI
jgi:superfamily II DNA or RNA helicase